jgi:uncharacterized membrane protein (DUF4010 family)
VGLPLTFCQLTIQLGGVVNKIRQVAVALRSGIKRNRGFAVTSMVLLIILYVAGVLAKLNDVELGTLLEMLQSIN